VATGFGSPRAPLGTETPQAESTELRTHKKNAGKPGIGAELVSFNFPNNLICEDVSMISARAHVGRAPIRRSHIMRPNPPRIRCGTSKFSGMARTGSRPAHLHLGTASPAQRGALRRASRTDGGESVIIRRTSTPNPAGMEADRVGRVYRVSPVVDGEFVTFFAAMPHEHHDLEPLRFCHPVGFVSVP